MRRERNGRWWSPGRRRFGFAGILAGATSIVIVVTCAALTWMLTSRASDEVSRLAIQHGRTVAERVAAESELGVLAGDVDALAQSCAAILGRDDVVSCAVVDVRGRILAASGEGLAAWGTTDRLERMVAVVTTDPQRRLWQIVAPVRSENRSEMREELQFDALRGSRSGGSTAVGYVLIGLSRTSVDASQRRLWELAVKLATVIGLLGVAGAVLLARHVVRPMQRLVEMSHAIAEGRLDASVDVSSDDEIGTLAAAFNQMAASLRDSRARLFDQNRRLEAAVRARTRQLEEMNEELRNASELKSEFLATVSHELRTPLNVIIGYAEILRETLGERVDPEYRAMLESIERYSRLQLDLITNVLDFSRLASGRIGLDVTSFLLEPVLAEVAALHRDTLARRGVTLQVQVDPAVERLHTDRVKVQEIVRNLLDNAVKFTEHGSIGIFARIGQKPALVAIEVRDSGAGIAPEDLQSVFEEFRQVGQSSTRSTGGVGLGLAIVHRLCEALGGTVRVDSRRGVGSTFVVEIPIDLAPSIPAARSA
ncbi:HAMP domain-containing protein [Candidatus Binatia bacterium]|nr:HAMP domain-containing protein [Candidatus Binatia bacterium]